MRKYYLSFIAFLFTIALILPMAVSATNALVFDEDTNVYLEGIPLTIVVGSGSEAEGMDVYPNHVTFDMDSDSTITITSSDRRTLTNDLGTATTCGSTSSSVSLLSTSTQTVSVTPGTTCGGGGSSTPSAPSAPAPTPTPTVPSTTTGEVTATATSGGETTVTTSEDTTATVEIPAQAVTANTAVTITPTVTTAEAVSTAVAAVPSGQSVVGGNVYSFAATAAGQAVTTFAASVTVTLTYTDTQVSGLDESSLTINYWDASAEAWTVLTTTVNTATNTLTASTTHFTYFAIIGETTSEILGVTSVSPVANATGVVITTNITATFTKDLDTDTVTVDSVKLTTGSTSVSGAISVSGKTITFEPVNDLSYKTVYSATLTTAIKATDETSLTQDYSWSFTTAEKEKAVSEMTIAELKVKIAEILAAITQLQAQLTELTGVSGYEGCAITSFERNLKEGMIGDDVKCLQIVLNAISDTRVAVSGVGSSGNETTYFGSLTKAAVVKFQEKYTSDILSSWGLTSGTGFVGSTTIEKLNSLLGK
ncbi:Ig-like domain-containing protein [Patescibacteria group bacterium]